MHGNPKLHLLGGLVPSAENPAPGGNLQRQLLPLRDSERHILHVEL